MKISCLIALSLFTVLNSFGQQAIGPSAAPSQSSDSKIGQHFKVIPAADGTHEVTLVGNGLNYQDTNGNWIASIPVVQSFPNAIVCTGASYRVLLATNLNTSGSVDVELPADPATGQRGRMVSHPLGIAFYDPDSGATVLLAPLKDCSAQIVSNQVIFTDAFVNSNGIQGAVTYTYDVGHFHQDVTLTARPSVTPADFGMGPNAQLEMLTDFEQSPVPEVTENTVSSGTSSATSAMTTETSVEPTLIDQTLDYGTMQMRKGRAFSTTAASPLNALTVTKQLVTVENQNFLTEDVPWDQAAPALQNLPASSNGTNSLPPQASLRRTMPRQQMIAQLSAHRPATTVAKSFKERLADVQRLGPMKIASIRSQPSSGFVMDYEMVQTCDSFTFQSGYTYLINSHVQIGYCTIESGAVIKSTLSGNLGVFWAINCPDNAPKAVITDMNDDSAGQTISGSLGYIPVSRVYTGLDLSQLDDYPGYVHNLDIRFFNYGIAAPTLGNANDWCQVYDCWFFGCGLGATGTDYSLSVYTSDFCNVGTPYYPSDIYASGNTTCSVDRNGNGLPDAWEMTWYGNLSQTASGDYDGNGVSNQQDYLSGASHKLEVFTPLK